VIRKLNEQARVLSILSVVILLAVAVIAQAQQPNKVPRIRYLSVEFVINLKTAKQIGLTIPPNVLARANKVIR
jgi:ABC-type uncharacterized transport system substrate-binding protein